MPRKWFAAIAVAVVLLLVWWVAGGLGIGPAASGTRSVAGVRG